MGATEVGAAEMGAAWQPSVVFVSHAHEDNAFTQRLTQDLRGALGAGTQVWHDVSGGLHGGDQWWNTIVANLSRCDVFVLVVSAASQRSRSVGRELSMAWVRNLRGETRIVPILIEHCDVRLDLSILQYITFLPPRSYDDALQDLVAGLCLPPTRTWTASPRPEALAGAPAPQPTARQPAPAGDAPTSVQSMPNAPQLLTFSIVGTTPPRLYLVDRDVVAVGRGSDNDLILDDPSVSRHHLRLSRTREGWEVERLLGGSTLYLNGKPSAGDRVQSGDQLVIGGTVLRFEQPDTGALDPNSPPTTHSASAPPHLVVDGQQFHFVAPLRTERITLGRSPDSGIVIPAPVVSAHHAALTRTPDGSYIIENVGGQSPLTLQSSPVRSHKLRSGDQIVVGAALPDQAVTLTYTALR